MHGICIALAMRNVRTRYAVLDLDVRFERVNHVHISLNDDENAQRVVSVCLGWFAGPSR